ncbi:hypothetical protein BH708_03065 [Brachybacterium sp. P6-10-X1]|uniref:hypothetical protein n=1 Tax=Brachybacterium sp. P6-10-X1 TaxID=1903186 RepID=UPI000971B2C4|nr:hypothetical protein [Brachybacterium sp. P6-10-X1]APX31869.1 hypothetical protein BH708_03065 [Brachybacterium sp. P6-10-X1]
MMSSIVRKRETGEMGNRGEFGTVTRGEAAVDVGTATDGYTPPPGPDSEQRYTAKKREANNAFQRYETLSAEVNEMAVDSMSRTAAEQAPTDAVAVGIAAEYDELERPEDTLRGIRWVRDDGSIGELDDETEVRMGDTWSDVDRSMIPWHQHAGLVERGDSGLPADELTREDVEYVIPIRGREHGMDEPTSWR